MKTILNLRRHHYLRTVSSLLIAAVLIVGAVSCTPTEYNLTMAVNPTGGGTATDETGTSPYAEGTVVNITAVAAPCYRFIDWTAPAGTFGNATAAETTFTMPARDVNVTANFEPVPPDHFKFYEVDYETAPEVGVDVHLVDQFGAINATVGHALSFGNAVEKEHPGMPLTPIADENRHYTIYELEYEQEPQSWEVVINNQFQDDVKLRVEGPYYLAVPTQKEDHEAPTCLDHLLVYEVMETEFPEVGVNLKDQFIPDGEDVVVSEPVLFANPVQKTVVDTGEVTEIESDQHYVFYYIEGEPFEKSGVQITNQFDLQTLDLLDPELLAVPTQKISWEQPLDHFKGYNVNLMPTLEEDVQLEDQFITDWLGEPLSATVGGATFFANPVGKEHGEVWTPISNPNNHLTFYYLSYGETSQAWLVKVTNQFGINQELVVYGPIMLAVPTKKGLHDPPRDIDHFLVYQVGDVVGSPPEANVYLQDQWTSGYTDLDDPILFANPVKKTHGSDVTPIKHPNDHLLFYWIGAGDFSAPELPIENQFGPQFLPVLESVKDILGVPSVKVEWSLLVP